MRKHLRQGRAWHESDSARLHATSPGFHAGDVAAPALIIHGDAARTVPVEHGRRMAKALAGIGRPQAYLALADAGQDLGKYGLRYSHLGWAYKTPEGPWRVMHKLNDCGTALGHVYRQGLGEIGRAHV